MKDYEFANRLYTLRTTSGLSQKQLAEKLGITNKAVSKWENGVTMPTVEQLLKLSSIFNITVDELIKNGTQSKKRIYKFAITGGPCSGKSTALSYLQEVFTKRGYMVMIVPENATELILGGVSPWTIDTNYNFEKYILQLQLEKERLFKEAAFHIEAYDKILIICDRGSLDIKAYLSSFEFEKLLTELHTNEITLMDSYDAVFHLVTAADGASEFYTQETNEARYENIEEAIKKDKMTLNAWTGHPHLRVVDNSTDFKTKLQRLENEILNFLGEDSTFEIQRKFLIEYPNIEELEKLSNCQKIDIIQTYLKSKNGLNIRIRQRGQNGNFTYAKTIQQRISPSKKIETETRITENEYLRALLEIDTTKRQIRKTRYCLMHNNKYFECDIYPFWQDKAILEIKVKGKNEKINFPKYFKVIQEITDEEKYTDSSLVDKESKN